MEIITIVSSVMAVKHVGRNLVRPIFRKKELFKLKNNIKNISGNKELKNSMNTKKDISQLKYVVEKEDTNKGEIFEAICVVVVAIFIFVVFWCFVVYGLLCIVL